MTADNQWAAAQRLEGLAGEVRVNLIRLAALAGFYGNHLLNVYFFDEDPTVRGRYHASVTVLVLAWLLGVLVVHLCVARRWLPPGLKFAVTAWDLLLITSLLVAGKNAHSMLAALYFLVIASAALRLSLPLVWCATLGAMAGELFFLGWLRYGLELPAKERLERPQQIILLLALGGAGLLAGQVVRQCRRVAGGHPVEVVEEQSKP
jgi:hypothetical protein